MLIASVGMKVVKYRLYSKVEVYILRANKPLIYWHWVV